MSGTDECLSALSILSTCFSNMGTCFGHMSWEHQDVPKIEHASLPVVRQDLRVNESEKIALWTHVFTPEVARMCNCMEMYTYTHYFFRTPAFHSFALTSVRETFSTVITGTHTRNNNPHCHTLSHTYIHKHTKPPSQVVALAHETYAQDIVSLGYGDDICFPPPPPSPTRCAYSIQNVSTCLREHLCVNTRKHTSTQTWYGCIGHANVYANTCINLFYIDTHCTRHARYFAGWLNASNYHAVDAERLAPLL